MAASYANALKRDDVYEQLKEKIVSRKYVGGQQLSERKLAESFGVARATVRVSLLRLANEGFVDNVKGVGMFVKEFEMEDVRAKLYLRELHEGAAAKFAARRVNQIEARKLMSLVDELERSVEAGDNDQTNQLDLAFHFKIADLSGDPTLRQLIHSGHGLRIMLAPDAGAMTRESMADHRHIAEAIAGRDEDAAERAMRRHISAAAAGIMQHLENQDYGVDGIINGESAD